MEMTADAWVVWPILLPLVSAALAFLLGRRATLPIVLLTTAGIPLAVGGLAWQVWRHGPQQYAIGGWLPPLGIALHADGLSALMLLMTALVGALTNVYALGYFSFGPDASGEEKGDRSQHPRDFFWPLWFFLWGAMNALFLSADLFNLYVCLEMLSLSAAALVSLAGGREALTAGMRYLLLSFLASLAYLLGVALLYGAFGTLDMALLGLRMAPGPAAGSAIVLMILGLALKTALFPLHAWLPPAHGHAPTPVSALLSGLVVKASFYLLLRLWFSVFPAGLTPKAGHLLGILGASAILWGSFLALRQERLKLLIAYSTVAQIGYLFFVFPLAAIGTGGEAWRGGVYYAFSHAFAKGALFMAAGSIMRALGHDRIDRLGGISQQLPVTMFAVALASVNLMSMPPSGGFVAKWLLIGAALRNGQWGWAVVMIGGGLLAAGYLFRILRQAFVAPPAGLLLQPVPRSMEAAALILALAALLLGIASAPPLALLEIGSPFPAGLFSEGMR